MWWVRESRRRWSALGSALRARLVSIPCHEVVFAGHMCWYLHDLVPEALERADALPETLVSLSHGRVHILEGALISRQQRLGDIPDIVARHWQRCFGRSQLGTSRETSTHGHTGRQPQQHASNRGRHDTFSWDWCEAGCGSGLKSRMRWPGEKGKGTWHGTSPGLIRMSPCKWTAPGFTAEG